MTCTICEADVVLSTWTFDEDGNIQSQDECENSGCFVGEEEFCKCFDLSAEEWKSICHSTNNESDMQSEATIVCLCAKCGDVVNKLKSLHEQLNRIQMELSCVKGTLLMEIVDPSQLTHLNLNSMKNSPFRQFIKKRFSPGINTKDLDIKGLIRKDETTNYTEIVESDVDMDFHADLNDELMSVGSLSDDNQDEDVSKSKKSKFKRNKSTKKTVLKGKKTKVKSETGTGTGRLATVEVSPGIFRFREKWDFEQLGEGLKVKCLSCQQIFPRRAKVIFHIMKHHNLEKIRCATCKKSWKTQDLLDTHNCRPRPIIRNFKTKVLPDGKTVIYDGQWEYSKIDETLDLYQCGVCSVIKRGKKIMNTHIKERHIDPDRHVCEQCGRAFGSKKHFLCHMELHSNEHYVCDECGHVAKTRATLYLHKQTHSTWLCPYCQHTYTRKRGLKVHVQTYHAVELAADLDSGNPPSPLDKILLPPPVSNNILILENSIGEAGGQKMRQCKISQELPVHCPNCRRKYATSKTLAVHLSTCRITELVCPEIECAGRAAFESYEPFHSHMYRHRKLKEKQQQENCQQLQL